MSRDTERTDLSAAWVRMVKYVITFVRPNNPPPFFYGHCERGKKKKRQEQTNTSGWNYLRTSCLNRVTQNTCVMKPNSSGLCFCNDLLFCSYRPSYGKAYTQEHNYLFTPGPLQSLRSYHRVYAPFCATVTSLLMSSLADDDTQEEIIYNNVCAWVCLCVCPWPAPAHLKWNSNAPIIAFSNNSLWQLDLKNLNSRVSFCQIIVNNRIHKTFYIKKFNGMLIIIHWLINN